MSISAPEVTTIAPDPAAVDVEISGALLRVILDDGREIAAPLAWFPKLRDATPEQQRHWTFIGRGHGIHWPDVDEDVSVRTLLGRPS